jgi:NAD(P) transhydrogenase subunit alpha
MEHVDPTVFRLAIFVLAIFVGYYVVWSVTPALHTPLMAVTNAISSVIVVGGLIAAAAFSGDAGPNGWIAKGAGVAAVTLASVNIFGGFMVTRRMLAMYRKKEKPKAEAAKSTIDPASALLCAPGPSPAWAWPCGSGAGCG